MIVNETFKALENIQFDAYTTIYVLFVLGSSLLTSEKRQALRNYCIDYASVSKVNEIPKEIIRLYSIVGDINESFSKFILESKAIKCATTQNTMTVTTAKS